MIAYLRGRVLAITAETAIVDVNGLGYEIYCSGGAFKKIAYMLPFVHAVEMERAVIAGSFSEIFPHLWWVLGYAAAAMIAAVLLFLRQMKKQ